MHNSEKRCKECITLAKAGYEVHLLVPNPPANQLEGVFFHAIDNFLAAKSQMDFTALYGGGLAASKIIQLLTKDSERGKSLTN